MEILKQTDYQNGITYIIECDIDNKSVELSTITVENGNDIKTKYEPDKKNGEYIYNKSVAFNKLIMQTYQQISQNIKSTENNIEKIDSDIENAMSQEEIDELKELKRKNQKNIDIQKDILKKIESKNVIGRKEINGHETIVIEKLPGSKNQDINELQAFYIDNDILEPLDKQNEKMLEYQILTKFVPDWLRESDSNIIEPLDAILIAKNELDMRLLIGDDLNRYRMIIEEKKKIPDDNQYEQSIHDRMESLKSSYDLKGAENIEDFCNKIKENLGNRYTDQLFTSIVQKTLDRIIDRLQLDIDENAKKQISIKILSKSKAGNIIFSLLANENLNQNQLKQAVSNMLIPNANIDDVMNIVVFNEMTNDILINDIMRKTTHKLLMRDIEDIGIKYIKEERPNAPQEMNRTLKEAAIALGILRLNPISEAYAKSLYNEIMDNGIESALADLTEKYLNGNFQLSGLANDYTSILKETINNDMIKIEDVKNACTVNTQKIKEAEKDYKDKEKNANKQTQSIINGISKIDETKRRYGMYLNTISEAFTGDYEKYISDQLTRDDITIEMKEKIFAEQERIEAVRERRRKETLIINYYKIEKKIKQQDNIKDALENHEVMIQEERAKDIAGMLLLEELMAKKSLTKEDIIGVIEGYEYDEEKIEKVDFIIKRTSKKEDPREIQEGMLESKLEIMPPDIIQRKKIKEILRKNNIQVAETIAYLEGQKLDVKKANIINEVLTIITKMENKNKKNSMNKKELVRALKTIMVEETMQSENISAQEFIEILSEDRTKCNEEVDKIVRELGIRKEDIKLFSEDKCWDMYQSEIINAGTEFKDELHQDHNNMTHQLNKIISNEQGINAPNTLPEYRPTHHESALGKVVSKIGTAWERIKGSKVAQSNLIENVKEAIAQDAKRIEPFTTAMKHLTSDIEQMGKNNKKGM